MNRNVRESGRWCRNGLGTALVAWALLVTASDVMLLPGRTARADEPALTEAERLRLAKDAAELSDQAIALYRKGQFADAVKLLRRSVELMEKVYPKDKFPQGHSNLLNSINNLGLLLKAQGELGEAEPLFRRALGMAEALYPREKYPQGHLDLATSVNNLAFLLHAKGEYGQAEPLYRRALEICEALYPREKYPQGHPNLATCINNLGGVLKTRGDYARAEPLYRRALEMKEALYPRDKYPQGHLDLAESLNNLAMLLQGQGDLTQAEPLYRRALEMTENLFPKEKYPQGHPSLAISLKNLASLLSDQGEYARAEPLYQRALEMSEALFPKERYPRGHPDLANAVKNLAFMLNARGEHDRAEALFRRALKMTEALYPKDEYPQGHPDLANSITNLASLLEDRKEFDRAEPLHRRALEMAEALYPKDEYPQGHPDLARRINGLAVLMQRRGDYARAEALYCRALQMTEGLYPEARYPHRHPDVASAINNLAGLYQARGESGKSLAMFREALALNQSQFLLFADTASEVEALNFLALNAHYREALLTVSAQDRTADPAADYPLLWDDKAASGSLLLRRQRLARGLTDDATRARLQELLNKRQLLARLLLAPADPDNPKDRLDLLEQVSGEKEKLERELARQIPEMNREQARRLARPNDLAAKLPARAVFVDLFRYRTWEARTNTWGETRYVAFMVRPGQEVVRAELGDGKDQGEAIEKALARWRQDIANNLTSQAAEQLRRLVWEPLVRHIPKDTDTVYVCPDGELSALPWAALPGADKDSVLLDQYAIALVPSGLALLEALTDDQPPRGPGSLLVVGGVAYDDKPASASKEAKRPADVGDKKLTWPALPGTVRELDQILAVVAGLKEPLDKVELRGKEPATGEVLNQLQRARFAHLATHGFFASPSSDERKALFDPRAFGYGVGVERRGAATRNPLVQSGLVLAGANVLPRDGLLNDGGILTAESLAGADLRQLRLVVLSACETGLGETDTLGQGVFGLQRAFHMGGCPNVVASLWKVEDEPTAALMATFYHYLWEKGLKPLEALTAAQRTLRKSPQLVSDLAKLRGSKLAETVKIAEAAAVDPKSPRPKVPYQVGHWAAFVLSGAGR